MCPLISNCISPFLSCQPQSNSLLEGILLSQHIFILAFYFRTAVVYTFFLLLSEPDHLHHLCVLDPSPSFNLPFFLPDDEIRITFFYSTNETTDSIQFSASERFSTNFHMANNNDKERRTDNCGICMRNQAYENRFQLPKVSSNIIIIMYFCTVVLRYLLANV